MLSRIVVATLVMLGATAPVSAIAQEPVKIGVVAEFSGPFADYGAQIVGGMKTYLRQNGDVFGGRKVEIIVKDTTGPAPDIAKRLAQELVTRDNVDILAGFGLTPNALGPGIETPMVTVCGGTRLSGTFSATAQKSITVCPVLVPSCNVRPFSVRALTVKSTPFQ